jgi:polysaccharide export outer membrane protein
MNRVLTVAVVVVTLVSLALAYNLMLAERALQNAGDRAQGLKNDIDKYGKEINALNATLEKQREEIERMKKKDEAREAVEWLERHAEAGTAAAPPPGTPVTDKALVGGPGVKSIEEAVEEARKTGERKMQGLTPPRKIDGETAPGEGERKMQGLTPSGMTPSGGNVYTIDTGDVLSISVWENADLDRDVIVRPDGKISFPLVDELQAKGLSIRQLDLLITDRLKEFIRIPDVSVSLKKVGGKRIAVLGAVKNPGVYYVEGKKTILEAIALAGGTSEGADLSKLLVMKDDKDGGSRRVDVAAALREGTGEGRLALEAQDVVFVPSPEVKEIMVLGEVRNPGLYKLKGRETVLEAIALAGGNTKNADLEKLVLMRSSKRGTGERINLRDALDSGGDKEAASLSERDLIYVPPRAETDKVLVLGEVRSPGMYSLSGRKTVLEAIAQAGGYTHDAVLKSVIVIGGDLQKPDAKRVNVALALKKGKMEQDIVLAAQNIVYVPRSFISKVDHFVSRLLGPITRGAYIRDHLLRWD